jgi:hypothetical protein
MSQAHKIHSESILQSNSSVKPFQDIRVAAMEDANATGDSSIQLVQSSPSHSVSQAQRDFFAHEPGLVQVFEVDYEKYYQFDSQVTLYADACLCCIIPGCCYFWACDNQNVRDRVYATHVAVTQ